MEKTHYEYIKNLEDGVTVIDDDISTGYSLRFLISKIDKVVKSTQTLLYPKEPYYDVVDARDFLVGSRDGGLVVFNKDNEYSRIPYLFPYVNLYTRASIDDVVSTSYSLWCENLNFFDNTGIKISDCDPMFVSFIKEYFDINTIMVDFCNYHIEKILKY
jgi:hypothetical protein